jgi:predicted esterase
VTASFSSVTTFSISLTATALVTANFSIFYSRRVTIGGVDVWYRVWIPDTYNAAVPTPVTYNLPGSGELGTDNVAQIGPSSYAGTVVKQIATWPAIMVFLQWQNVGGDGGRLEYIYPMMPLVIAATAAEFNIDPDRVSITGLSLGALMTCEFLVRLRTTFSAALVCSGYLNYNALQATLGGAQRPFSSIIPDAAEAAAYLASIQPTQPIWQWENSDDPQILPAWAHTLRDAYLAQGNPKFKYVLDNFNDIVGGGHSSWVTAFPRTDVRDWLYAQRRNDLAKIDTVQTVSTTTALTGALSAGTLLDASTTGTATVTASLTTAPRLAISLTATATTTPNLATAITLAGGITTSAAVTATLVSSAGLAVALTATATTTATLAAAITMGAALTGSATITAALATGVRLAASVTGAATTAQALATGSLLGASVTGTATTTATLAIGGLFAVTATGSGLLTASTLTTGALLSASTSGAATVTPALLVNLRLSASLTTTATLSAPTIATAVQLAASLAGAATISAGLVRGVLLSASVTGTGDMPTANLRAGSGLDAILTASCGVSAQLAALVRLVITVSGTATTSAALSSDILLGATLAGTGRVSVDLSSAITLAASVTASASAVTADLTTAVELAASLVSTATLTAPLATDIRMDVVVTGLAQIVAALIAPSERVPELARWQSISPTVRVADARTGVRPVLVVS